MATRNPELEARAAAEGATAFVEWFYRSINDHASLAPFYVTASARYRAAPLRPDVSINGSLLNADDPAAAYEALLRTQRGLSGGSGEARVRYEVDSVDAQVVNPEYGVGCPEHLLTGGGGGGRGTTDPRLSLLVQVGGWVSFGADKDAPRKTFSEVFVLVPNWESFGRNAPRNARRYLILSQNFRAL